MQNTIDLLKKQHDVLVDVIQYLDSTKQSNTKIRSQVDTILNHEKKIGGGLRHGANKNFLCWLKKQSRSPGP